MAFTKGDVVCLKSGGAPMTVHDVREDYVDCTWWGREGPQTVTLKAHCLVVFEEKKVTNAFNNAPGSQRLSQASAGTTPPPKVR